MSSSGTRNGRERNEWVELYEALDGERKCFDFSFQERLPNDCVGIKHIGWEKRTSTDYYWDGLKREKDNNFVFQYTLSGFGVLELGQTIYQINPGEAFIVQVPSDHRYYLPPHSEKWEFVFITLKGKQAGKCWRYLYETIGPVLKIQPDRKLIHLLIKIYRETKKGKVTDAYLASARGYEFVMECYRFAKKLERNITIPNSLDPAISFIKTNFHSPITLDDIAAASSVSKYYLIKQFKEHLNTTPIRYLTKVRIKHAADLLLNTNLPIKKIATEAGFSNDNYFNKVFRKMVGMSAGSFRKYKASIIFD